MGEGRGRSRPRQAECPEPFQACASHHSHGRRTGFGHRVRRDRPVACAPELYRDFNTLRERVSGVPSQGLTVQQHERLARGLEAYFMEDKAPSSELNGVFENYRRWLKRIYRTIANLNVELNDDVRRVIDLMFATEEENEAAAQDNELVDFAR